MIRLSLNCNKAKLSSSWHNGFTEESEPADIREKIENIRSKRMNMMNKEIGKPIMIMLNKILFITLR